MAPAGKVSGLPGKAQGAFRRRLTEQLKDCISKQIRIESKSLDKILSRFETIEIKKGDYFLKSGTVLAPRTPGQNYR